MVVVLVVVPWAAVAALLEVLPRLPAVVAAVAAQLGAAAGPQHQQQKRLHWAQKSQASCLPG